MPSGVADVSKAVGERVVPPTARVLLLSCLVYFTLWISLLRIKICVSTWCTLSLPLPCFSFVSIEHILIRTSQICLERDLELLWWLLGCRNGMSL